MVKCRHSNKTDHPRAPMQIGRELVTYEDIICDDCGQLVARRILKREKVK